MAKLNVTLDTETMQIQVNEDESTLQNDEDVLRCSILAARFFLALWARSYTRTAMCNPEERQKLENLLNTAKGIMMTIDAGI